jgi:hypothetical protein
MTVAATAASVAAISSLAAYINAKYHIGQDLRMLKFKKGAEKHYAELGTLHRDNKAPYTGNATACLVAVSVYLHHTQRHFALC